MIQKDPWQGKPASGRHTCYFKDLQQDQSEEHHPDHQGRQTQAACQNQHAIYTLCFQGFMWENTLAVNLYSCDKKLQIAIRPEKSEIYLKKK